MLPPIARMAAQLLPSTHAMNAFKGLAMGQTADFSPWGSLLVLLSGGLLAFCLAPLPLPWGRPHRPPHRRREGAVAVGGTSSS